MDPFYRANCASGDEERQCYGFGAPNVSARLEDPGTDVVPSWFLKMLSSKFFTPCERHNTLKKNEGMCTQCTYFCADCNMVCRGLCQHCLPEHPPHHTVIQIRRYVYCDVVRTQDVQRYLDPAGVQTYIINQAKVVFLNHRPQSKPAKVMCNVDRCMTCKRTLREGYSFCSLACKVNAMQRERGLPQARITTGRPRSELPCAAAQHASLPSSALAFASAYGMSVGGGAAAAAGHESCKSDMLRLAAVFDPLLARQLLFCHPTLAPPAMLLAHPAGGCWKRRKQLLPQRSPLS